MYHLGIDIGGSSVKTAIFSGGGHSLQLVRTGQSTSYQRPSRVDLLEAIRSAVGPLDAAVESVGLCMPGLLDESKQRVTMSVNVPVLSEMPLRQWLLESLGQVPQRVTVLPDSAAAAMDIYETRRLSGRLFVLAIGTGIGAAVIDEGKLLRVDGDSPGHFGQCDVSLGDEPVIGPDGGAGSLEGYLGRDALVRRYQVEPHDVANLVKSSDPPLRALARAIRIAHAMYRPHHVCLAGGLGIRLRRLLPELRAIVDTDLTTIARPQWTFTTGDSDFHAAMGAARSASAQGDGCRARGSGNDAANALRGA